MWPLTTSASKSSIWRFVISWLKVATTAFTFRTLLRHHAKRSLCDYEPSDGTFWGTTLYCVPCSDHIGHHQPWTLLCCRQHNIFRPQEARIILVITTAATSLAAFIKQFTRWTYAFYAIFWAGSSFKLNNIQNTSSSLWQRWGRRENEPAGSIFHMFKAVHCTLGQYLT